MTQLSDVTDKAIQATLTLLPPEPALVDFNRYLWQQQLATAEATHRVQSRQARLLQAQREIVDEQLSEANAKADQAARDMQQAHEMLASIGAER
ncbi:hypothetical protein SEA_TRIBLETROUBLE_63 [Mycobacterium Phage TribleTrouble]|nr:hypothetical protein SEA_TRIBLETROUBLE_63 [Mycobacterium Phage TribleTrouble]